VQRDLSRSFWPSLERMKPERAEPEGATFHRGHLGKLGTVSKGLEHCMKAFFVSYRALYVRVECHGKRPACRVKLEKNENLTALIHFSVKVLYTCSTCLTHQLLKEQPVSVSTSRAQPNKMTFAASWDHATALWCMATFDTLRHLRQSAG
jgi:hypothetical protein